MIDVGTHRSTCIIVGRHTALFSSSPSSCGGYPRIDEERSRPRHRLPQLRVRGILRLPPFPTPTPIHGPPSQQPPHPSCRPSCSPCYSLVRSLSTVNPAGYPPDNFHPKRTFGIVLLPLLSLSLLPACCHHQLLYWPLRAMSLPDRVCQCYSSTTLSFLALFLSPRLFPSRTSLLFPPEYSLSLLPVALTVAYLKCVYSFLFYSSSYYSPH